MSAQLLSEWCDCNGFLIDSRICICHDEARGVHVVSKNIAIPSGSTLVRIPKDSVLSVKSCPLSKYIPFELHGLGAQLGLALALYSEILRGDSSPWSGYIRSLSYVDLPVFWGCGTPKRPNGVPAFPNHEDPLLWLQGTEVQKLLDKKDDSDRTVLDSIDHYYHESVMPILQRLDVQRNLQHEPNLVGFQQAYSFVSSRAFLLDAYHGLAMTPVADAFNHVLENHVHIESDFYVCPDCGSLAECVHDRDGRDYTPRTQWGPADPDLYYEIVTGRQISQQEEVFNTYGSKLSNAQLLMQYGFILDPNDNDTVNFDMDEILHSSPLSEGAKEIPHLGGVGFVSIANSLTASNLVHACNLTDDQSSLCIDSDGKISYELWLLLVGFAVQKNQLTGPPVALHEHELREAIAMQLYLEGSLQEDRPNSAKGGVSGKDPSAFPWGSVLIKVGHTIINLCEKKKGAIGPPGFEYTDEDLGEILDTIPEDKTRLRLALSTVICERSILDSCRFGWLDFVDNA